MTIDQVILSADNNPMYLSHWPRVARCWKKLGFRPILAWVTDDRARYDELSGHGTVYPCEPAPDIPDGNMAKILRMFWACRLPGVSMLSDIDMMPISGEYFTDAAKLYEHGTVLSLSSDAYRKWASPNRHPICYLIADTVTWCNLVNPVGHGNRQLLDHLKSPKGIDEIDDIGQSPFSDESLLQWMIGNWGGKVIGLERTWHNGLAHRRVDRADWQWDGELALRGHYIDAHLPRPVLEKHGLDYLERFVK
jgi:hypothetical protein